MRRQKKKMIGDKWRLIKHLREAMGGLVSGVR